MHAPDAGETHGFRQAVHPTPTIWPLTSASPWLGRSKLRDALHFCNGITVKKGYHHLQCNVVNIATLLR
jgi:hypothetical protein